ncbi:MAG: hypothetical protein Kow00109_25210 [Acidobacteriota bacterium]
MRLARTHVTGKVWLVGAGPGDPELITVKGLRLVRAAEVVLYDRLAPPELLEEAPASAERIYVGKEAGSHHVPQDLIHRLLLDRARSGKTVVRLKGGDPLVFGRGGEELLFLRRFGIPCEVVPGVTSALGAAAAAQIPLTLRGVAATLLVTTGHLCGNSREEEWSLAARADTLVVLMPLATLSRTVLSLIHGGKDAGTPAALVENATRPQQRVLTTTLGELPALVEREAVSSPALLVVGPTVACSDAWVTRRHAGDGPADSPLPFAGAEPVTPDPGVGLLR